MKPFETVFNNLDHNICCFIPWIFSLYRSEINQSLNNYVFLLEQSVTNDEAEYHDVTDIQEDYKDAICPYIGKSCVDGSILNFINTMQCNFHLYTYDNFTLHLMGWFQHDKKVHTDDNYDIVIVPEVL